MVRNGHARERTIVSGVGQLKIQAPRVDDRRVDEQGRRFRFNFPDPAAVSAAHEESVEELIPWLYLKGISTGDFSEALEALLGPGAPGLSATTVVRLKDCPRLDLRGVPQPRLPRAVRGSSQARLPPRAAARRSLAPGRPGRAEGLGLAARSERRT